MFLDTPEFNEMLLKVTNDDAASLKKTIMHG